MQRERATVSKTTKDRAQSQRTIKEYTELTENNDQLDDFYNTVRNGIAVELFLSQYNKIIEFVRSTNFTNEYRLANGRVKQLRDEITPVARFIRMCCSTGQCEPGDRVRFSLCDAFPDCVLSHKDGRKREIEVTVVRAKERLAFMEKLNETGEIHGIVNLPDDAALRSFQHYAEKAADPDEAQAYSTEEVADLVIGAVESGAERKAKHKADTLLIEVVPDMHALSGDRWHELRTRLSENHTLKKLAFGEVYVTGSGDNGDICLKIK